MNRNKVFSALTKFGKSERRKFIAVEVSDQMGERVKPHLTNQSIRASDSLFSKSAYPCLRILMNLLRPECFQFFTVKKRSGDYLLSRLQAVPSAQGCLTSVFGMGTGVPTLLWSPDYIQTRGATACRSRVGRYKRRGPAATYSPTYWQYHRREGA